jgi:hypothetical protein
MLSGVVTWVGRSSMSIRMEATQVALDGTLHASPSLSVCAPPFHMRSCVETAWLAE